MKRKIIYQHRKSLTLKVVDDVLVIKAPIGLDSQVIEAFIQKKQAKLLKQAQLNQQFMIAREKPLVVLGQAYPIENFINLENQRPVNLEKKIRPILNQQLFDIIQNLISKFQLIRPFHYQDIRIKKLSATWGNCSSKKVLTFSSRLIHCPLDFIEAVVAHEISHLFEMNHSSRFYQVLSEFCPDYQRRINLL